MTDSTKRIVPSARKELYLSILTGISELDSKWDRAITDGKMCVVIDGAKVVNSDAKAECATDYALVSLERDGIGEKHADYKSAMKVARTVFSNGVLRRMRPDAMIRQKNGKPRPGPFAGWKVPKERDAGNSKGKDSTTTASVVAAIAIPVATLRPLSDAALSAANDVCAVLAAMIQKTKPKGVAAKALAFISDAATVTANRVKAIAATLPEVSDVPATALADALNASLQANATQGNGDATPAS